MWFLILTLLLCQNIPIIRGSIGDQSPYYQKCLNDCVDDHCKDDGVSFKVPPSLPQDVWCWALQWGCRDECSYLCMWRTVQRWRSMDWAKDAKGVPKFHGKWPFKRLMGVQEPASAAFSLLNLAANLFMYLKIRKEFPMKQSPLIFFWHVFAFVCMNAWFWSTVFHIRDKPFTEFMDYACALSMVMGLFIAAFVRLFHRMRRLAVCLLVPLCYYCTHVQYLYSGRIDYDYNMRVNVMIGALGTGLWLGWACVQVSAGRRYARSLLAFTLASSAALLLELLDFPPLWGSCDAHALWHLATAPLPLIFYRFVIDDLRFLRSGQYEKLI